MLLSAFYDKVNNSVGPTLMWVFFLLMIIELIYVMVKYLGSGDRKQCFVPGTPLNIADIRKDYKLAALDESTVGYDPIIFFAKWFSEAEAAQITERIDYEMIERIGNKEKRSSRNRGIDGTKAGKSEDVLIR